jgi:DNA-binding MarR family transcriptional regulator
MSPNAETGPDHSPVWLSAEQLPAWMAYIRVQLRLSYEINWQLQCDSELSLPDFDVLTSLGNAPQARMRLSALAAQIGWERSRLSHHLQRMSARGLVRREPSPTDGRATDAVLTEAGRIALTEVAPGHVALVRRLFFDGLPEPLLAPLTEALENIYENIIEQGTLPRPEAG